MQTPDVVLGMLVETSRKGTSLCHTCIHSLAGKCTAGESGVFHSTMLSAGANPFLVTKAPDVAVVREADGSMRLAHIEFSAGTDFVYRAQGRITDLPLELHNHCPAIRRRLVEYVTLFISNLNVKS